jgi:hypothetical protein
MNTTEQHKKAVKAKIQEFNIESTARRQEREERERIESTARRQERRQERESAAQQKYESAMS